MVCQIRRTPHGLGAGAGLTEKYNERWANHTMPGSAAYMGLQFVGLCGTEELPNLTSRNKRRSDLPKAGKSLVHASAYISTTGLPSVALIGRVQRPSVREALAALLGPGSVVSLPFFFNPHPNEVSYV